MHVCVLCVFLPHLHIVVIAPLGPLFEERDRLGSRLGSAPLRSARPRAAAPRLRHWPARKLWRSLASRLRGGGQEEKEGIS